jgi:Domain of unknown function (DUF4388)
MTKGRDNAAENLSDVLELIRKRQQSGLLSVERSQGGLFEEGEIFFQTGQLVYARLGQLSSVDAITQLLSWRQVYFAFLTDQSQPSANIASPVGTRANIAVATEPRAVAADPRAVSIRPSQSNSNSGLPFKSSVQHVTPDRIPQSTAPLTGNTPGLEWLVPQKRGNDRDVLSLPLTRPQRSIYLLIDGKRTVSDLSRCTRKSFQEIERLLSELQQRGLIVV